MSRAQVLVVGSGAGGAVTALSLAERGHDVLLVEEGPRSELDQYGRGSAAAMQRLYRDRGMTPIVGRVPIGFVEGRCVGGSTEINSGFWHPPPRETLIRWKASFDLQHASPEELAPHVAWAEEQVSPRTVGRAHWPPSTRAFARGIEAMEYSYAETPRVAPGCQGANMCAMGCPTGAKQGMSRSVLPAAERAGVRLISGVRVMQLLHRGGRVRGVLAWALRPDGSRELIRIDADHVFVCCGPTQTPALLRRSGIRFHVGDTLQIHPMLKVAARFPETVDAHRSVLPLLQVKHFWPDATMGGAFFTPGHLAMHLSENWPQLADRLHDLRRLAMFYVAVRGVGRGSVRPALLGNGVGLTYRLTRAELRGLSSGMARLAMLLLAGGADEVYPGVQRLPVIRSEAEAARWLDDLLPRGAVSLTTVHAFSSCPAGERAERCAVHSDGRVVRFDNLYVSDASILPDSPGVNPQGSVMAFARRNALMFSDRVSP